METIVIYPAPGLSHLLSVVELAKLLLYHSHSLAAITFLIPSFPTTNTPSFTSYVSSVSSAFPSISFHSLPPVPLSKPPSEYPKPEFILFENLRNSTINVQNVLHSLSLTSTVSAFILDFFCYSALEASRSLNIPSYFFFTSNAAAVALFLNFPVFDRIATDSFRNLDTSFEIPGLFSVPSSHMLEPMLDRGECYDEFVRVGDALAKSDGVIINTFEALEGRVVEGLKRGTCLPATSIPPTYCIGPLIADQVNKGDVQECERHECLTWLDSQPSQSVVYLNFGTYGRFSKEQVEEIAHGLERSMVRFLWVVREPPSENNAKEFMPSSEIDLGLLLPEGFLDRTKERGLVVKAWAPQTAILGHKSVGGFVTHCGWNSILEAVLSGIPMVAWPLYAEQRFNKIVIVQEIGIALPMEESKDRFVSSNEIERRMKQLMESDEGNLARRRVLNFRDEAKVAFNSEGSSTVAITRLVESWKR